MVRFSGGMGFRAGQEKGHLLFSPYVCRELFMFFLCRLSTRPERFELCILLLAGVGRCFFLVGGWTKNKMAFGKLGTRLVHFISVLFTRAEFFFFKLERVKV